MSSKPDNEILPHPSDNPEQEGEKKSHKPSIRVVVNPASGQDQPFLKTINTHFQDAGWDWDLVVTKGPGDGERFAREAVAQGVDVVAAYGGDGTVMEVASGLAGTEVLLAILPGGTGNVISIDLGIPRELDAACALIINPEHQTRQLDLGKIGDKCFLLRLGIGFEADVIQGADRAAKDQYGMFAYFMSIMKSLKQPELARYDIEIDGEQHQVEGIACLVANVGNLGVPGMTISPAVDPGDGVMDVFVIQSANLGALLSLATSVIGGDENQTEMLHWQAHTHVHVTSDPPQLVQGDGEIIGHSPVDVHILPGAIKVIVPLATSEEEGSSKSP